MEVWLYNFYILENNYVVSILVNILSDFNVMYFFLFLMN